MKKHFSYKRRINFYETDLMGIVHHSNYLRIFEEARVAWFNQEHVFDLEIWKKAVLGIVESHVEHTKPLRFNDEVEILMQVKNEGPKFIYQYQLMKDDQRCAKGWTHHVLMTNELKVCKPPHELIKIMENEIWIETWL